MKNVLEHVWYGVYMHLFLKDVAPSRSAGHPFCSIRRPYTREWASQACWEGWEWTDKWAEGTRVEHGGKGETKDPGFVSLLGLGAALECQP